MLACPTPAWLIVLYTMLFFGPMLLAAGFGLAVVLWAKVGGWRVGKPAVACAFAAAAFAVAGATTANIVALGLSVAACAAGLAAVRRDGRLG